LIDARNILVELGMPKQQLNERTALCLLSLVDIKPNDSWSECTSPLMGITPIMDWCNSHYKKYYAPNSHTIAISELLESDFNLHINL
jgi:hypothetical protein